MGPLFIFIFYNHWVQDHERKHKPRILDWGNSVHQCSVITKFHAIQSLCNEFTGKYKSNAALENVKTSFSKETRVRTSGWAVWEQQPGPQWLQRQENIHNFQEKTVKETAQGVRFQWAQCVHAARCPGTVSEFYRNTTESIDITLWFESCPAAERSSEQCGEGSPVHQWDRAPSPGQQTITNPLTTPFCDATNWYAV